MSHTEHGLHAHGAALTVSGVRKTYGPTVAVAGVSFDLGPGEFLTMLGPSGSGKTTTLNMIAGFEDPDEGHITLSGTDITHTAPHKRDIGVVFQNYALFPHMSALKNVMFPLLMRGERRSAARTKAQAALEMVELSTMAQRLPRQLSGGQQQRVALARAFVFEPGLLLMDEPLGALDKRLREQMQLEIMRICRNVGSTVVYVTHDQQEALTMSDQIAVYNNGSIEQISTPTGLYEQPATVFVADFIGDSSTLACTVGDGSVVGAGWKVSGWEHGQQPGPATLVLRPEDVTLARRRPDDQGGVDGVVEELAYHGSHVKCIVRTQADEAVVVLIPRSHDMAMVNRGDPVTATWRSEAAVLLGQS